MYTNQSLIEYETRAKNADATSQETVDGRAWLQIAIPWVCERIDEITGYTFAPMTEVRYFDASREYVVDNSLFTQYPMLSVTSVAVLEVSKTKYTGSGARGGYDYMTPLGATPWFKLIGLQPGSWMPTDVYYQDAIAVTGVWGYRKNYPSAGWATSGGVVNDNPLSASATTLNVDSGKGSLFSPGMLIQIESEVLSVSAIATDALTVVRGQRGTTAASHVQATAIKIWEPEPPIERAATLWVADLYGKRGVREQFRIDTPTGILQQFNADAPPEVSALLDLYTSKIRGLGVL